MQTIYKLLNDHTKKWWHYQNLRRQGKTTEARRLERNDIKSSVEDYRNAFLYTVGDYGSTLYIKRGSWLSSVNVELTLEICYRLNIPVIDSRGATDQQKHDKIGMSGPTLANLNTYLFKCESIGLKVFYGNTVKEQLKLDLE